MSLPRQPRNTRLLTNRSVSCKRMAICLRSNARRLGDVAPSDTHVWRHGKLVSELLGARPLQVGRCITLISKFLSEQRSKNPYALTDISPFWTGARGPIDSLQRRHSLDTRCDCSDRSRLLWHSVRLRGADRERCDVASGTRWERTRDQ